MVKAQSEAPTTKEPIMIRIPAESLAILTRLARTHTTVAELDTAIDTAAAELGTLTTELDRAECQYFVNILRARRAMMTASPTFAD
jgi:hypothetical protein